MKDAFVKKIAFAVRLSNVPIAIDKDPSVNADSTTTFRFTTCFFICNSFHCFQFTTSNRLDSSSWPAQLGALVARTKPARSSASCEACARKTGRIRLRRRPDLRYTGSVDRT